MSPRSFLNSPPGGVHCGRVFEVSLRVVFIITPGGGGCSSLECHLLNLSRGSGSYNS